MSGHSYTIPDGPKMLRETLCVAQVLVSNRISAKGRRDEHLERLGRLIAECDRKRPFGPDGKHDDRHTPECGCDDVPPADTRRSLCPQGFVPKSGFGQINTCARCGRDYDQHAVLVQ